MKTYYVSRYTICTTTTVIYEAAEDAQPFDSHSYYPSLGRLDGRWYGTVTSRRLPDELEAMKGGSPERIAAVREFQNARQEEAYAAILAAFPETMTGKRRSGEISMTWDTPPANEVRTVSLPC